MNSIRNYLLSLKLKVNNLNNMLNSVNMFDDNNLESLKYNGLLKCDEYLDYVISEHKKLNPSIKVIKRYIGEKNEIVFRNQNRNYLYHINASPDRKNMWSIIPGKFTLAFSIAPEFYRRVYHKNPRKLFNTQIDNGEYSSLVANTAWYDAINI